MFERGRLGEVWVDGEGHRPVSGQQCVEEVCVGPGLAPLSPLLVAPVRHA